ncbi:MAG TPA: O-antigen ligase family protein [Chitinophagaceae bacterium]|nr:O-antigen ligase family protein [Chitinophagaceae bacterium]
MQPSKGFNWVIQALYIVFFVGLACSFRAISSIVIVLLLIAGLIRNRVETKSFFNPGLKNPLLYGCVLLFLLHLIALFYTGADKAGWADIQVKTGLVLTPLAFCVTTISNDIRKKLGAYFIGIITAVACYCLVLATYDYFQSGDTSIFFYHSLVQPVHGHAIYFAVLVFIALLFLLEAYPVSGLVLKKPVRAGFIIFLSIFLFLLSSRLVIGFYLLYLLVYLMGRVKKKSTNRFLIAGALILVVAGIIALSTNNPVSRRFSDIMTGNWEVVRMEKFNPGMYFNGVQFRLLQWRFTAEILNENHGWLAGIGPGHAQQLLDQKYIATDMYIGEPARGDHGFLGYNTHNQFLESLLKTGICGPLILLLICFTLVKWAWQKRKRQISFIVTLFIIWLFTEAVLERQYGIQVFIFFPLFLWKGEK